MISAILRTLPAFKGKHRLARLLLKMVANNGDSLIIKGKHDCVYHLPNAKETIGFEILVNGIYEERTILFIREKIPQSKYLLDIGANIGAISIPLKKLRPDISIICLEAAPWVFDYLEKNITDNRMSDIVAVNKAIAAKADCEVEFFSPNEKFGKGSLAPVFTDSGVKVTTVTLDLLTEKIKPEDIGLIKIDVEGFESHAFRGGEKLLGHSESPDILFEFVDWAEAASGVTPGEAQGLLMSFGYKIFVIQGKSLSAPIDAPIRKGSQMLYASK